MSNVKQVCKYCDKAFNEDFMIRCRGEVFGTLAWICVPCDKKENEHASY